MPTLSTRINNEVIETIIISNPFELRSGLSKLLSIADSHHFAVGLDIEQTKDKIDLLKLASGRTCLLIQLSRFLGPFPLELSRFLQLPQITFVGVGINYSLDALQCKYDIKCRNSVDVGALAAAVQHEPKLQACGLLKLASYYYCAADDCVKSPDVAFGDWNATVLSQEQISSATTDVYVAFLIGSRLLL